MNYVLFHGPSHDHDRTVDHQSRDLRQPAVGFDDYGLALCYDLVLYHVLALFYSDLDLGLGLGLYHRYRRLRSLQTPCQTPFVDVFGEQFENVQSEVRQDYECDREQMMTLTLSWMPLHHLRPP